MGQTSPCEVVLAPRRSASVKFYWCMYVLNNVFVLDLLCVCLPILSFPVFIPCPFFTRLASHFPLACLVHSLCTLSLLFLSPFPLILSFFPRSVPPSLPSLYPFFPLPLYRFIPSPSISLLHPPTLLFFLPFSPLSFPPISISTLPLHFLLFPRSLLPSALQFPYSFPSIPPYFPPYSLPAFPPSPYLVFPLLFCLLSPPPPLPSPLLPTPPLPCLPPSKDLFGNLRKPSGDAAAVCPFCIVILRSFIISIICSRILSLSPEFRLNPCFLFLYVSHFFKNCMLISFFFLFFYYHFLRFCIFSGLLFLGESFL